MPNIDLGKVVGAQGPEGPVAQGTMMEATYDPNGKSQDVFAYADAAKQEAKDYAAPKTHASQHASGGSDPITPSSIGAAPSVHTHTASDVGALSSGGTAAAATKLATARTIRTNLASTSTASFNGTANVTPGVTGTLPVANGGTGHTSISALVTTLANNGAARITSGTYAGTGASSFTLTFSVSPKIVFIVGSQLYRVFAYGNSYMYGSSTSYTSLTATWNSTSSVTLKAESGAETKYAERWENASGTTYTYYVIY